MNDNTKYIELLSPAKDLECGLTAINNGADAVYIGGPGFGARKQAGNSLADIEQLIKHAHLYRSKVYMAVNTVLKDHELEKANQLIHSAYNTGVDAIIIQDMGLLETDLPPIPIHASTQTDNRTVEKVQFLEQAGFDQVVLARELSLNQIKNIRQHTNVALEYFIHGALCVSYSGQCYMSASINGRSANRGECAQPCRLKYSLKDRNGQLLYKDKHLLSLKDLNHTPNIENLIEAGINSFKIEGRLKSKDYVANITAHYRNTIDNILENKPQYRKTSSGTIYHSFNPDPRKSFNRGFTEYYLHGRKDSVWSIDTPKSLGEPIGKVVKTTRNSFTYDGKAQITNGDGLCFFDKHKNLQGLRVNTCNKNMVYPDQMKDLKSGTFIYRNYDTAFQQALTRKESHRKIDLNISLIEFTNYLELRLCDEDGIESSSQLTLSNPEPAINKDKLNNQTKNQLSKLGNTPFNANSITLNFNHFWFTPTSSTNELRRQAIEKHIEERLKHYPRITLSIHPTNHPYPVQQLDYKGNITNQAAKDFYKRHGANICEWGVEIKMPQEPFEIMTTKHCLLYMAGKCLKEHPEIKKTLPLILFNKQDSYTIEFDCKVCEMRITK